MQASIETMRIRRSSGEAPSPGYLDGQMLVAMPGMMDERFARTVIYLCAHSPEGAMGIVVNKPAADLSFPDLLVQLDIIPEKERTTFSIEAGHGARFLSLASMLICTNDGFTGVNSLRLPKRVGRMQVLMGGPVETGRGFVLHSPDFYLDQSTLPIDEAVCLTATIDILRAIAKGEGPRNAVLALGYAGWSAGQLETEIQANGWLNCPADPDLIFHSSESKYELAMRKLGIDPAMLSTEAGHA